jgi:hypothetical protein
MLSFVLALVAVLPVFVASQSPVWGQCGGENWGKLFFDFTLSEADHSNISGSFHLRRRLNLHLQ